MQAKAETESSKFERLLVRGVNWLGDAVMTTPALLRLREARPRAHVTLLTHVSLEELWTRHPAVDAVDDVFRPRHGVDRFAEIARAEIPSGRGAAQLPSFRARTLAGANPATRRLRRSAAETGF